MTSGSANESADVLDAPTQAWWSAVFSGQPTTVHPTHSGLRARLAHARLSLSGVVATEDSHKEVLEEARIYGKGTVENIEDQIEVRAASDDEAGILSQTVFATFENKGEAERAAEVLRHLSTVSTDRLVVLAGPDSLELNSVPEAYRAEVVKALVAGRGVLTATVDETNVLALREVLDQDTASIETVVAPPEVTSPEVKPGAEK